MNKISKELLAYIKFSVFTNSTKERQKELIDCGQRILNNVFEEGNKLKINTGEMITILDLVEDIVIEQCKTKIEKYALEHFKKMTENKEK